MSGPIRDFEPAMSSMEMVEFINEDRKVRATTEKPYVELRHDNFMAKVPKVLGVDAPKFLGSQKYGNNNSREVYFFPKREACLMAMSYSYELQAKVWDRMIELEAELALQQLSTYRDRLPLHQAALEMVGRHGVLFSTAHIANNALAGSRHYNEMTKGQVEAAIPAAMRLASGTATEDDFARLQDGTREQFGVPAQMEIAFDRTSLIGRRH